MHLNDVENNCKTEKIAILKIIYFIIFMFPSI